MEALFLLIPLSLALLGVAVWLYFRMDESGQFKDVESHGRQLLMDDDSVSDQQEDSHHAPPDGISASHKRQEKRFE